MRAGISRVSDRAPLALDPQGERLLGVHCCVSPYTERALPSLPAVARLELHDFERAAGLKKVVAVGFTQSPEHPPHPARPDQRSRRATPLPGAVRPRPEERGEVAHVIGVEVGDCDVRDRLPLASVPGQPVHRSGAAIEQDLVIPELDQVCGRARTVVRQKRSRAEDRDSHSAPRQAVAGRSGARVPSVLRRPRSVRGRWRPAHGRHRVRDAGACTSQTAHTARPGASPSDPTTTASSSRTPTIELTPDSSIVTP